MGSASNILIVTLLLLNLITLVYCIDSNATRQSNKTAPTPPNKGKEIGKELPQTWVPSKVLKDKSIKKKILLERKLINRIGSEPVVLLPGSKKKYCVPKPEISDQILQENIDWGCKMGVDCDPLVNTKEVSCYDKSLWIKAAYVMNYFFNASGRNETACDFNKSGFLTPTNPTDGKCAFV